ncbi:putative iron-regulated membrane protein [Pseudarthrobacter siccitolerans]|uniref:Iron-regulated membrane protein n=1 Tax=Pseudarthrobacter siccitolerans TaxID=861266 RepID=A0ABU0PL71_9MICC|nr:putative iron-regulated membrane protein [Pseudarthrobacter siccitolerans]
MEAIVAISEYAFSLCVLLATLLIPVLVLHQVLWLKRRAVRIAAPVAPRGNRR